MGPNHTSTKALNPPSSSPLALLNGFLHVVGNGSQTPNFGDFLPAVPVSSFSSGRE